MSPVIKKIFYFALVIFVVGLAYHTLFHPVVFETLLKAAVSKTSNARLQATVKRASPIYGFEITDIKLDLKKNLPGTNSQSLEKERTFPANSRSAPARRLLSIKRLRLSWFLPGMLAGHIGLREFSLQSPRIYLERRQGLWNWERAFPTKESKSPRKKKKSSVSHSISFFTELRAYLNIKIEDAEIFIKDLPQGSLAKNKNKNTNISIDKESAARPWSLKISGLNFRLALLTNPMTEIPLNADALGLLRTTLVALNPFRPIEIEYKGQESLKGKLTLQLLLFQDKQERHLGKREFALRLVCDGRKLALLDRTGKALGQVGLHLHLDSSYDAKHDRLLLHRLELGHGPENWLSAQARLSRLSIPERELQLRIFPSHISLERIDRLLAVLSNAPPEKSLLRGSIQIAGIEAWGRPDRLELKGGLHAHEVLIATGAGHRLKNLALRWHGRIDLYRNTPPRLRPADYEAAKPLAFGMLDYLQIPMLKIHYNGMELSATAHLNSKDGLRSDIYIKNFDIKRYLPKYMAGRVHARLSLSSPKNFSFLDFGAKIDFLQMRYFLGRSRSGYQNLHLASQGRLNFSKTFSISIKSLQLLANSLTGRRLLTLRGSSELFFGEKPNYQISLKQLQISYPHLKKLLPGNLRDRLRPAELYLSKGIALRTNTNLSLSKTTKQIRGNSQLVLPYLRLQNLQFDYKLALKPRSIHLQKFQVHGLKGALSASLEGKLTKPPLPKRKKSHQKSPTEVEENPTGYRPDLHLKLRLAQKDYLQVHENIRMQGLLDLKLNISPKKAKGNLKVENLNLAYFTGECSSPRNPECHRWVIRKLNLHLPLEHNLEAKAFSILSQNPARYYASGFGADAPPNLSVQLVFASHNPQGQFQKHGFYYIGSPKSKSPGLQARLSYKRNILLFKRLNVELYKLAKRGRKKYWKSSGQIRGQDIYFNLADLKPRHIEANAMLQLKNLDLEPFLPESRSNYDGIISADLNFRLSSLKNPLYHTEARLAVYRISNEFSGFVTRILMPTQVVAMLARNFIEIPAINIELKGGLVYSTIQVRRARIFPGMFIAPGKSEIKQERMPLAQFLSRAKSEVRSFGNAEK